MRLIYTRKITLVGSEVLVVSRIEAKLPVQLIRSLLLDTGLLIFTNSPLKEVCFSLKRDHVHPFERIFSPVLLRNTKLEEETISDELNVLVHQLTVHTNQLDR